MFNSKIEWCDHTVNFWTGCTKVSSGCANCYAESLDKRFYGGEHWGTGNYLPRLERAREECLRIERRAAKDSKPVKVFVNSMSDWLDSGVPIEWLAWLLDTIRMCPHVTFLCLSKRIDQWLDRMEKLHSHLLRECERIDGWHPLLGSPDFAKEAGDGMLERWVGWNEPPANVWIGCTVENQEMADKRIPWLLQVPATKHFISYEPALGPVDAEFYLKPLAHIPGNEFGWSKGIDWVICGGESGPNARPMHPDWAQSLRDQCKAAGVPFFFKQWGAWAPVEVEDRRLGEDRSVGHVVDVLPSGEVLDGRDSSIHADAMERVGKARAGHLLDGVEHHEFPNI